MTRTGVLALSLTGALLLGGCGTEIAPVGDATDSPATSQAAGDGAAVGEAVALGELADRAAAAVESEGTAHVSVVDGSGQASEADVDLGAEQPRVSMTTTREGRRMRVLLVDGVVYLGGDAVTAVAGGRTWLEIDPEGDDPASRFLGSVLEDARSSEADPSAHLDGFGDLEATVVSVEGGVTTYELAVSEEQMKEAARSRGHLAGLPGGVLDAVQDGATYTVSFDAGDLPVAMTVDAGEETYELTYSAWGEPVDITAPPESEVGTFELPTG
jgi:hypothetical protein